MKSTITAPIIVGVDEAGRGALAGRVYAAAVVLPESFNLKGLTDSKKLSAKKRESMYSEIIDQSLDYAIGYVESGEIDQINILRATMKAMQIAVMSLKLKSIDQVLIDGNCSPELPYPTYTIIKGDLSEPVISAASVLAKVSRDHYMNKLHQQYPHYFFNQHKGYPTELHYRMIKQHGACIEHRKYFAIHR